MIKEKFSRHISWFGLAATLVSLHFGLGFLLGSGEAIYVQGPKGILYAFSTALGLFSLAGIAAYYWRNKLPIWDLLGKVYGKKVKNLVAFLSGAWMIGVLSSQILGGAAALSIFGLNKLLSMLLITLLILAVSLTDIKRVAKILLVIVLFTGSILLYMQFVLGWSWAKVSFNSFFTSVPTVNWSDITGIILPTILVTFIGMDFHQFIVRAKSEREAVFGNIVGGIILLAISFLTLNIVYASIKSGLIQNINEPAQVLPAILFNFGKSINPVLGSLLPIIIVFVAVGSGSGIQRIVVNTLKSFKSIARLYDDKAYTISISAVCFLLALSGTSIIKLIVNFYAIYVGSVFLPFIYFLLQNRYLKFKINPKYINRSLYLSFIATIIVFLAQFLPIPFFKTNTSALIIGSGFATSLTVIGLSFLTK